MSEIKTDPATREGPSTSGTQQQKQQQVSAPGTAKPPEHAAGTKRWPLEQIPKENKEPPLDIEHATPEAVPLHMLQLLDQCKGEVPKISSAELMMHLIYLVALESGFVENETYNQTRHKLKPVPSFSSFHAGNVRILSLETIHYVVGFNDTMFTIKLRTLQDKHATEEAALVVAMQSTLRAVHLGDELMVSLSPPVSSKLPGYSIALSTRTLCPQHSGERKTDLQSLSQTGQSLLPGKAAHLLSDAHPATHAGQSPAAALTHGHARRALREDISASQSQ
ncbi:GL20997 [Drosophila persimilis]|uniref:GL20997 n=1 Tax=Drosophila persimilis TaxID=7234 RepID=B4H814_DROPE|nr:GL20997 [Drosophila persimilis]